MPNKIDLEKIKSKRKKDIHNCDICKIKFTVKLGKYPMRHCKRCARAVCEPCSGNKRLVARTLAEPQRVCDYCDTEMDNYHL